jgi:hypothetical protein
MMRTYTGIVTEVDYGLKFGMIRFGDRFIPFYYTGHTGPNEGDQVVVPTLPRDGDALTIRQRIGSERPS